MTGMLATLAVPTADRPVSNAAGAALLDAWLRNREKYDLLGHGGSVNSVAFSPDGKRVVTGSDDNTARVWDLSGATPPPPCSKAIATPVMGVAFSPDGKRVVTGSHDGTARVWETPPVEMLIPLARAALTRCLTIAQRDGARAADHPRRRPGPRTRRSAALPMRRRGRLAKANGPPYKTQPRQQLSITELLI